MNEDRKPRILCVEDEVDIRENIADILRDEGFEVFEADNGKHGYEAFLQHKPDVIISDIMMPEIDGYGFLKLVRQTKNNRNNTVPFILLTALGQKDDVIKGVDLLANDYLVKPIDFDMLIAKIREKIVNSTAAKKIHERDIKNIKDQVAIMLPSDVSHYLDVIMQSALVLKDQPYGPLPHRRYIEDLDTIYINAAKLRAVIANSLDHSVIDSKIQVNEEVIAVTDFISEFIAGLSANLRAHVTFEAPFDAEHLPRLKIDRLVFNDAFRKILVGLFRFDHDSSVKITVMIDHRNQMVIIFYYTSNLTGIDAALSEDEAAISKILDQQSCHFTVSGAKDNTALLTIPSYRLINR